VKLANQVKVTLEKRMKMKLLPLEVSMLVHMKLVQAM